MTLHRPPMSLLGRVGRSLRCYWPPWSLPRESSWPARVRDLHPQNYPLMWGSWAAYRRVRLVTEHSTLLYWNLPLRSASLLCTWLCTYVSPHLDFQVPLGCLVGFPVRSLCSLGDTWWVPWIYLYTHTLLCTNRTSPKLHYPNPRTRHRLRANFWNNHW